MTKKPRKRRARGVAAWGIYRESGELAWHDNRPLVYAHPFGVPQRVLRVTKGRLLPVTIRATEPAK